MRREPECESGEGCAIGGEDLAKDTRKMPVPTFLQARRAVQVLSFGLTHTRTSCMFPLSPKIVFIWLNYRY